MSDKNNIVIGNTKLILFTLGNAVVSVLFSALVTYYFQAQSIKNEKLIDYRIEEIKAHASAITEVKSLIESLEVLIRSVKSEDFITTASGGKTSTPEVHERTSKIIDQLNRLGEVGMKLPYQLRIVAIMAKNHFGIIHGKVSFPETYSMKLETENLTGMSFELALDIAKEEYIANGEPRHKELAKLIVK